MKVPFFDIHYNLGEESKQALLARWAAVLEHGLFVNGPEIAALETELAEFLGVPHVVACSNGSDALVLALRAAGVEAGDEVLVPAFTFFATAGAVSRLGAVPVFCDVDPATFNLDSADAARRITEKTTAVLPVHLYGRPMDVGALRKILNETAGREILVVEDAAQAVGAVHADGPCGALGETAAFSCFPTKNLGATGDAGFATTLDAERAERMRSLRQHGGGRQYFHDEVGYNFRLDGLAASTLSHHLPQLTAANEARAGGAEHYGALLAECAADGHLVLPAPHTGHVWHQFVIRCTRRDELQKHLKEKGIGSAVYYPLPLHLQPCFKNLGAKKGDLPESENAAAEVLALPIYPGVTPEQREAVAAAVKEFSA
jgi:dTDP-4-amino-4,6-dideoxygalactose transaminase